MAIKGVYKRGSVYWIRYAGPDSRIIRESSKSHRFKDAEAFLFKRKQQVREGLRPENKRIKDVLFKELAVEYLRWAERQNSYKQKEYSLGVLLQRFGDLRLSRFTLSILEQYQTEILIKLKRKPATCNRYLALIKHMFTKAVEWRMSSEETLKEVRKVKFLPENNRRLRFLSQEECNELLKACSQHIHPIVATALHTGMRRNEILRLRWSQVDFRHGFILLEHTKNGDRREIPINQTLKSILHRMPRRLDNDYVFVNPYTVRPYFDLRASFKKACGKVGIRDFLFHDLRHTFASRLVMAGVDLVTVKELLGHRDIKMTLRYAHLAPGHKVKAVRLLDDPFYTKKSSAQLLHNSGRMKDDETV